MLDFCEFPFIIEHAEELADLAEVPAGRCRVSAVLAGGNHGAGLLWDRCQGSQQGRGTGRCAEDRGLPKVPPEAGAAALGRYYEKTEGPEGSAGAVPLQVVEKRTFYVDGATGS